MLNLASRTDPAWVEQACEQWDDILLDHAHCEKKAAGAAVNLIFRYPQYPFLHAPLSRLAREELVHFEQVLAQLEARDLVFQRQKPSAYGGRLHALIRSGEPERLLDVLLVGALIEARSCERFQLLADALEDAKLADLYRGLLASEARHHGIYLELARQVAGPEIAADRLAELAEAEAAILSETAGAVRLHS